MEKEETKTSMSSDVKLIHCKVIGGNQADIYEIGKSMKEFTKKSDLNLHAIISNENVEIQDVDKLILELYKLKKEMKNEQEKNENKEQGDDE